MRFKSVFLCVFTANTESLTLIVDSHTLPDNEDIHKKAENNLFLKLSSEEVKSKVSQQLTRKLNTGVKLSKIVMGSIKVDIILEDLSRLEKLKELSDKWVLTNLMDSILMTPEFIESCQAEDVAIDVVLDEESYQRIKNLPGECNVNGSLSILL